LHKNTATAGEYEAGAAGGERKTVSSYAFTGGTGSVILISSSS